MSIDWQQAVAIALVASTAAYLGWRAWKRLAGKNATGCGTCSACPIHETTESDDRQPPVPLSNDESRDDGCL